MRPENSKNFSHVLTGKEGYESTAEHVPFHHCSALPIDISWISIFTIALYSLIAWRQKPRRRKMFLWLVELLQGTAERHGFTAQHRRSWCDGEGGFVRSIPIGDGHLSVAGGVQTDGESLDEPVSRVLAHRPTRTRTSCPGTFLPFLVLCREKWSEARFTRRRRSCETLTTC